MSAREPQGELIALPNAVWGSLGPEGYREDGVYGRSAAMGDKLCAKFIRACKSWGGFPYRFPVSGSYFQVPVGAAERSAGMPGGVLAVAVTPNGRDLFKRPALFFHGIFLSDDDYARVGHQTFGLWEQGLFMTEWNGKASLRFVDVSTDSVRPSPPKQLQEGQVAVLCRELRDVLLGGSVVYTAFFPESELSDHLRLLQLGVPINLRPLLGFSVFLGDGATVGVGSAYAIAAKHGPGTFQRGRATVHEHQHRRWGSDDAIDHHVTRYGRALESGRLDDLLHLSPDHV